MKLERTQIIKEAIVLLNEQGLENVTLRKLAQRLSVKAPSLAWHVKNKNTLLSLMSINIFQACLDNIPDCENGEMWLLEFGRSIWKTQNKTRDAAQLISIANPNTEEQDRFKQLICQELEKVGLNNEKGFQMQSSVQALTTGWALFRNSPSEAYIEEILSIEDGYFNSLRALIAGWKV